MSDIATAYVRIRPDTSSFKAEAEKGLKGAFRGIGKLTVAAIGVTGLAEATKAVVSAAATQQVQLASLRKSVENVNAAWETHGKTVTEILESNARKTGFTVSDLASSFSRAVTATQNTTKAFRILTDAEDLARTGNLSLSQATLVLDRAYQGSAQSLRRYGIVIPKITQAQDLLTKSHENSIAAGAKFNAQQKLIYKNALDLAKARDKLASSTHVLDVVEQKFGGQAAVFAKTTQGQLARLKETLNQFEVGIGTQLLPTINRALGGLQHWVDGLRTNVAIHQTFASVTVAVSSAFRGVANVLQVVGPIISTVATATAQLVQAVGGGGLLAIAIGYKAIGTATGIAAIAQRKYAEVLAAGAAAGAANTAATASSARGLGILGAAAAKNAVIWDENTGAVSTYTKAQIDAAIAQAKATVVTQAQTAALLEEAAAYKVSTVAAFGGGLLIRDNTGKFVTSTREIEKMSASTSKLGAISKGVFASMGGWTTVAQIGVAALAFGIYKLAQRDTELEAANNRLIASQQRLDAARQTSANLAKTLAQVNESIPHDKEAVASAKLAVERSKQDLANTTAARGSIAYREAVHQVVSAVLFERDAVNQLSKDQAQHDKLVGASRYNKNQESKALIETAKHWREVGDAIKKASVIPPSAIRGFNPAAAKALRSNLPDPDAQRRAGESFRKVVLDDAQKTGSALSRHNDVLLAQLEQQLSKVPKEAAIKFILANKNVGASLKGVLFDFGQQTVTGNEAARKRSAALGESIVGGIVLGIKDKGNLMGDAMIEMLKEGFTRSADWLGAHSPSLKARTDLGQSIGDGVAQGIKDKQGAVASALVGVVDKAISAAVQHASNALGGSTGNPSSASGAPPVRRASGGTVPGSGSGDTVPAMLTPGEVVLNRGQQRKLLGRLGVGGDNPHQLFSIAQGFADGGVADWRGAAHQGGGMSRFDKWLHGWLLGKQGLSGAGADLGRSLDLRSKQGLVNLATMFIGPRGEMHPEDFTNKGGTFRPELAEGAVQRVKDSTKSVGRTNATTVASIKPGEQFKVLWRPRDRDPEWAQFELLEHNAASGPVGAENFYSLVKPISDNARRVYHNKPTIYAPTAPVVRFHTIARPRTPSHAKAPTGPSANLSDWNFAESRADRGGHSRFFGTEAARVAAMKSVKRAMDIEKEFRARHMGEQFAGGGVVGQEQLPPWVKTPEQALAYMRRGQIAADKYARAHGAKGGFGSFAGHFANTLLGLFGTNTKLVSYLGRHPLGAAEAKGPFALPPGAVTGGLALPLLGGPARALSLASRLSRVEQLSVGAKQIARRERLLIQPHLFRTRAEEDAVHAYTDASGIHSVMNQIASTRSQGAFRNVLDQRSGDIQEAAEEMFQGYRTTRDSVPHLVADLSLGLSKSSLPANATLFRGVDYKTAQSLLSNLSAKDIAELKRLRGYTGSSLSKAKAKELAGRIAENNLGKRTKFGGFTSTSIDPETAREFGSNITMLIRAKKGDEAAYISYKRPLAANGPHVGPDEREVILNRDQPVRLIGVDVGGDAALSGKWIDKGTVKKLVSQAGSVKLTKAEAAKEGLHYGGEIWKTKTGSLVVPSQHRLLTRRARPEIKLIYETLARTGKPSAAKAEEFRKMGVAALAGIPKKHAEDFAVGETFVNENRLYKVMEESSGPDDDVTVIAARNDGTFPQAYRGGDRSNVDYFTPTSPAAVPGVGAAGQIAKTLGGLKTGAKFVYKGTTFKVARDDDRSLYDEVTAIPEGLKLRPGETPDDYAEFFDKDTKLGKYFHEVDPSKPGVAGWNLPAGKKANAHHGTNFANDAAIAKLAKGPKKAPGKGSQVALSSLSVGDEFRYGGKLYQLIETGFGDVSYIAPVLKSGDTGVEQILKKNAKVRTYAMGGVADSVPAMLSPGEVVLNRKQQGNVANMMGMGGVTPQGLFDKIQRFADGGVVAPTFGLGGGPEVARLNQSLATTETKIANLLGFDAGKLHDAQGRVADTMTAFADTVKQSIQTIKDTIVSAKQNLSSIGGSLANDISTLIAKIAKDGTGGAAPTGPVAERLKALNKQLASGQSSPELVRAAQSLSNQLAAQQTAKAAREQKGGTQSEIIARKLNDNTFLLNEHKISLETFNKRTAAILKNAGVTPARARKELGVAFEGQLLADIKGLQEQAKAILASPNFGGGGLAPQIIKPLDQIKIEQKNIADAAKSQRAQMIQEQQNAVAEAKKHTALLKKIAGKRAADTGTADVFRILKQLGFTNKQINDALGIRNGKIAGAYYAHDH